ncbi:HAD family hydrolase [Pseudomonadota bacterium]
MLQELRNRHCWIFDLDGTLTKPIHNFERIRKTIGVPANTPILEYLQTLPTDAAAELEQKLEDIELKLAYQAEAEDDVARILRQLTLLEYKLGVVTRNTTEIAVITLKAAGLLNYFSMECILGRDSAVPKPSPAGINHLLTHWDASPDEAVMIGDYLFDLQAGKAAGTMTVYFDRKGLSAWNELTDLTVNNFNEFDTGHFAGTN